jgi:hypothetical protein
MEKPEVKALAQVCRKAAREGDLMYVKCEERDKVTPGHWLTNGHWLIRVESAAFLPAALADKGPGSWSGKLEDLQVGIRTAPRADLLHKVCPSKLTAPELKWDHVGPQRVRLEELPEGKGGEAYRTNGDGPRIYVSAPYVRAIEAIFPGGMWRRANKGKTSAERAVFVTLPNPSAAPGGVPCELAAVLMPMRPPEGVRADEGVRPR